MKTVEKFELFGAALATIALIALLIFLATMPGQLFKFRLNTGEQVECRKAETVSCGLNLSDCTNEQEYICQTNTVHLK